MHRVDSTVYVDAILAFCLYWGANYVTHPVCTREVALESNGCISGLLLLFIFSLPTGKNGVLKFTRIYAVAQANSR